MHANKRIPDRLLITYGPICKFVAEVTYFVDFGDCFSASRRFLHLSSYQPLHQPWKGRQGSLVPLSQCARLLSQHPLTRAATQHLDDSQTQFAEVASFKNKYFPPVLLCQTSVIFLSPSAAQGLVPKRRAGLMGSRVVWRKGQSRPRPSRSRLSQQWVGSF